MKKHDDHSGKLECSGDLLAYHSASGDWSVSISAIRLIGEYTNSDGPYLDDYFFVFLTAPEGGWHEASFYAAGRDDALRAVEKKLGAPIEAGLCDSTDYRTRILWPPNLKGQALMEVVPRAKDSFWQKLSGSKDITLSRAAREAFER
jgi:hypothetical protein